jgi:hypothetical protein
MRFVAIAFFVLASPLLQSAPALAQGSDDSILYCWHEERINPVFGTIQDFTVCRTAGGEILTLTATKRPPPEIIDVNVTNVSGIECWYWTTVETFWVAFGISGDLTLHFGYDPGGPGGPIVFDWFAPPCRSEPVETATMIELVWDIVEPHIHQVPNPDTSPTVGITGLETFISVTPPAPITDAIVSPVTGNVLTAEIKVAEVHVDWGDGATNNFPEVTFPNLTDYPDGIIRHEYQTKTCPAPGSSSSCHPSLAAYPITVSYEWFVRWRVNSEPWNILTIPDTLTSRTYDVDEIISRNVANG